LCWRQPLHPHGRRLLLLRGVRPRAGSGVGEARRVRLHAGGRLVAENMAEIEISALVRQCLKNRRLCRTSRRSGGRRRPGKRSETGWGRAWSGASRPRVPARSYAASTRQWKSDGGLGRSPPDGGPPGAWALSSGERVAESRQVRSRPTSFPVEHLHRLTVVDTCVSYSRMGRSAS
jgi:hypothetical protein